MILVKTLIFTVVVPGSVTVGVPYLLLTSRWGAYRYPLGGVRFLGILPLLLGALAYLWCARDFALKGKGTPAPLDPPRRLVSGGLYRIVRNPIYVGVELMLAGEAILFESVALLVYGLLLWVAFHLFVLAYEEPTLARQFGPEYAEYRKGVPRWIPRLRGPRHPGE